MQPEIDTVITNVFLDGDSIPIVTSLTVDEVAQRLADAHQMLLDQGGDALPFVRLPMRAGDALIRPKAIVAIVPTYEEDDDEDE